MLEVGAGAGRLGRALRAAGYEVVAIDPDAESDDVRTGALAELDEPAGSFAAVRRLLVLLRERRLEGSGISRSGSGSYWTNEPEPPPTPIVLPPEAIDPDVVRPEPVAKAAPGDGDRAEGLAVGPDRRWERLLQVFEQHLAAGDGAAVAPGG